MTDPAALVGPAASTTSREDYERMVLGGGFPLALARQTEEARRRWFRELVYLVMTRDVLEIRRISLSLARGIGERLIERGL